MKDRIQYDIALVGAGPANLALALRLVTTSTVPLRLAVLEKSKNIGSHLLSGAVSNPRTLAKLFPDWSTQEDFPLQGIVKDSYLTVLGSNENEDVPRFAIPPYFKKEGYAVLNISDLAHYMAEEIKKIAAEKDNIIVDFYPGFPAQEILFDGNKVIGIKVDNSSDERANNLYANVTVFGEKGFVSRDLIERFNLRKSAQTWAVGVKEVWEVPRDYEGKVWHTVGYPLVAGELGGGFIYGLKNNKIILGLITGLDSPNPNIRPVTKLQTLKKHPWVQELIKDGKLLQYGASVLPEGGYYALPEKFAVSGAMLVGDALGTLDVKRFSGVDKAMESGIIAADILSLASANNEFSESFLSRYRYQVMESYIGKELYEARYFRKTFKTYPDILNRLIPTFTDEIDNNQGIFGGALTFGLKNPLRALRLLGAKGMIDNPKDFGDYSYAEDRSHIDKDYQTREIKSNQEFDNRTIFSTADIVFYAHTHYDKENDHIEEFSQEVCYDCIDQFSKVNKDTPCVGDCTAEVHNTIRVDGKRKTHVMALENCVQCTTCEIVCPESNLRVRAALHGFGPDFSGM